MLYTELYKNFLCTRYKMRFQLEKLIESKLENGGKNKLDFLVLKIFF